MGGKSKLVNKKYMKIYMNYKSRSVLRSTDFNIRKDFLNLCDKYSDLEFYYPTSLIHDFLPLFREFICAALGKINKYIKILPLGKIFSNNPYMSVGPECNDTFSVVQSAGYVPVCSSKYAVLWECIYLIPEEGYYSVSNDAYEKLDERKNIIEKLLFKHKNILINVRCDRSVDILKNIFPKYSEHFINLPFLLPNLDYISDEILEKKFDSISKIKFLFVGAQAKRKGLDLIINALARLDDDILSNIEFNVVSGYTDGDIKIPSNLKEHIINHGALSHDKVIQLYKESHVYIMLSRVESYGLSYIEGLANGCVLITRDKYPQIEFTNHGEFGYYVNPYDGEAISRIMCEIIVKREDLKVKALKGLDFFKSNYHFDSVSEKWYNAYKYLAK